MVQAEDATFTCVATARPRPNITWWRVDSNGSLTQVMEEANVTSITEMMSGERVLMSNLTIVKVEACDAGSYTCVAENEVASVNQTGSLSVLGKHFSLMLMINSYLILVPPTITFPPDGHTFYTNEFTPAVFQCTATGIPAPEISWYRNETNNTFDDRVNLSTTIVSKLDCNLIEVTRMLTLHNAMDSDSMEYICSAVNGVGNHMTQEFLLFVKGIYIGK